MCIWSIEKKWDYLSENISFVLENKASKLKAGKKNILTKSVYKFPGWEGRIQQVFIGTTSK